MKNSFLKGPEASCFGRGMVVAAGGLSCSGSQAPGKGGGFSLESWTPAIWLGPPGEMGA